MKEHNVRLTAVIICIVGAVFLAVTLLLDSMKSGKTADFYEQVNMELVAMQLQKDKLQTELEKTRKAYQAELNGKATLQLLCTSPRTEIYDGMYPLMQEYGYTVVIALSQEAFPGKDGYMSAEQAKELYEAGWTFCYKYDGTAFDTLEEQAKELGISLTRAVYFKEGDYTSEKEEILADMEYAVHHGEEGRAVVALQKETHWYFGAVGWYTDNAAGYLATASKEGANLVFTVGLDTAKERFEAEQFSKMLKKIRSYDNIVVTSFEEVEGYQGDGMAPTAEEYLTKIQKLQDELAALEAKEQALLDTYMSQN